MLKKTIFWQITNYKFKFLHFVLGLISLIIIFSVIDYIYYSIYPSTFTPDINYMTALPSDVKVMEDLLNARSLQSATSEGLLNEIIKSEKPAIPVHFRIPVLVYHYVEYVKDRGD